MEQPNKILFLLHLPPPVHGSSVVGLLIKESGLINENFKCSYINLLASQNVAESGTVNSKKLFEFFLTWLKVLLTLWKERPNLCYLALTTTGAAFFKDLLLVALLKIFRIKRIYHLHNRGVSQKQHKAIYKFFYKFVFNKAEVILLSSILYNDIQNFVPWSKIHICPNGIPDTNNKSESIKIWQSDQQSDLTKEHIKSVIKPLQILFLSNLIESKGVWDLLNACVLLKNKGIDFNCVFIGGESDISASEFNDRVNKMGLNKQVKYQGKKYGNEKVQAYLDADIFVFPTYYSNECFPLVLLEAMSFSLPVISTYEGAISDIVEVDKTGLLVKQRNVDELADNIACLIKNENLRQQMGQTGRKKYEAHFTLAQFESRLAEILTDVLTKS